MKLIFLGSGSAFTLGENYQSNMLIESGANKHLLIDCGSDARRAMHELGFSFRDINDVYISHLHSDHVGGLEWLAFNTKFQPNCSQPVLHINEDLANDLWNKVLSGGLSSLKGIEAELSTYFDVDPIARNGSFVWEGVEFIIVKTKHVMNNLSLVPSYGLYIIGHHRKIFITTDSQMDLEHFEKYYKEADLIFQDCETSALKSGVHAHYTELVGLDPQIKSKMWLYHYQNGPLPDAQNDGFLGFVKKGQAFNF